MPSWPIAIAVLDVLGYISTILLIVSLVYGVYLSISGFLPVLIRLGAGLKKRKIAIFAKGDSLNSLQALFKDSNLFNSRNVIPITSVSDLGRAEMASVFLVYWPDWIEHLPQILTCKKDRTALIIYAPQGEGSLPNESILLLEQHRNVVLANLRGRLLNDIVISLITTGYEKKPN